MMWIAIHFPQLPLETLLRGSLSPEAWAIAERDRILLADKKALARGVRPGMLLSAAFAFAPQLQVRMRDCAAETEALLGTAAWAAQFTPSVALEFPDALVMEVSGSLKLFGGLHNIAGALRKGLADMGFAVCVAGAPTARAASWLARTSEDRLITDPLLLRTALEQLPVALFAKGHVQEALAAIGIATLGELLALPREGLVRRFGQPLLDELDRALGCLADLRSFFVPPPRFHAALEMPAEVTQAEALLFAGRRLLVQLAGFLAARSGGVQRFVFRLSHRGGRVTEAAVGLVAPSRDPDHFVLLLRERLATLKLREPVRSMTLEAGDIVPLAGVNQSLLLEDAGAASTNWPRLIERLRVRLGSQSVYALAVAAEHRPERASCPVEPGTKQLQLEFGERPFWLLNAPLPLDEIGSVPHYRGPLTLLAGPERIESGWWDGEDAKRDYFVARAPGDAMVWIFRERGPRTRWYLHGVFA
jgi:protein ImuB